MNNPEIIKLIEDIGNGSILKGSLLLSQIADRLIHARKKHSWQGYIPYSALTVIRGEVEELYTAVKTETPLRQHDEALDVAATTIRFLLQEWKD